MDDIQKLLMKDPVRNVNLINFMKNYRIQRTCREGDSVLVEGASDRAWIYISSTDADELSALLRKHIDPANDRNFAVIEPWMEPYIVQGRDLEWALRCDKYVLPAHAVLPELSLEPELLKAVHAGHIYENYNYSQFLEAGYIAQRIETGPTMPYMTGINRLPG